MFHLVLPGCQSGGEKLNVDPEMALDNRSEVNCGDTEYAGNQDALHIHDDPQNLCSHLELTWRRPRFVVAQLPPAVGATRVDTSIVQQEHGVKPPAGQLLQPPAAEHITVPWLKHGVRLRADTQLSILRISPTQHVHEMRVVGGG